MPARALATGTGRIYLANVGANASHGFAGPIFPDGTFEFLPIPEHPDIRGSHAVRYRDLRSHNDTGGDLLRYVPRRLWDRAAHNDPEFDTFTYGDNCSVSPRAAGLRRIEPGDFLLFIARLERWEGGRPRGSYGFYLVGYLHMQQVLRDVASRPRPPTMARFGANAHLRRGLTDPRFWDRFWVFGGSRESRRFRNAVPVNKEMAGSVFTSADGSPWRWGAGRSDLQVIGSYTRRSRATASGQGRCGTGSRSTPGSRPAIRAAPPQRRGAVRNRPALAPTPRKDARQRW